MPKSRHGTARRSKDYNQGGAESKALNAHRISICYSDRCQGICLPEGDRANF